MFTPEIIILYLVHTKNTYQHDTSIVPKIPCTVQNGQVDKYARQSVCLRWYSFGKFC